MFNYSSELFELPVYGVGRTDKQAMLDSMLSRLSEYHYDHCQAYKNLLDCNGFSPRNKAAAAQLPVATTLFKDLTLSSIPDSQVFRQMRSSGTSGQASKIALDADSAKRQSKVLVKILQAWLGKQRRPMLLIDSAATVKAAGAMTARAAGLQGLSFFGRDHCYALDENMQLDIPKVTAFFDQYGQQRVLMFGFTFIVWQQFVQALQRHGLTFNFADAKLIHGGGWKKMQEQAVTDSLFKHTINERLGNVSVHDYYGMVEQTGTIYVQCEHGYLHTPVWSDVLIRRPDDLSIADVGESGLIQVNSILPSSYPGHCLLTEDLGIIRGEDDCECGRLGKYFSVLGRVPKAEVKGCSDTFA
ncbi:LuxE/PaaK family acyltransferase [Alteromonas gilva]|uniref:Acyl-protein synthetase n=1 Tax=Alteromonas gilva TaxID=2987522 RepID=A0ABT5L0B1_9ALTE|nr:acyl-protein synthetase [Alteromonas gilva]MDC8830465.1 acyl-protein synthetase [Alteromonas gilva]